MITGFLAANCYLLVALATFMKKFSKIFLQIAWGMKLLEPPELHPVGTHPPHPRNQTAVAIATPF